MSLTYVERCKVFWARWSDSKLSRKEELWALGQRHISFSSCPLGFVLLDQDSTLQILMIKPNASHVSGASGKDPVASVPGY